MTTPTDPHAVEQAICNHCGHEWTAVHPLCEALECPLCHQMTPAVAVSSGPTDHSFEAINEWVESAAYEELQSMCRTLSARIAELEPLAKEVERLKAHKHAILSVVGGVARERKEQIKEHQAVIDLLTADLAAARSELETANWKGVFAMHPSVARHFYIESLPDGARFRHRDEPLTAKTVFVLRTGSSGKRTLCANGWNEFVPRDWSAYEEIR